MPMVRAMRLLNAVEAGTTSGAQLETLLTADPGRLAEWNVLLGMRGQARRVAASSTAMAAVIASSTAMAAVAASSTAMAAVAASSTAMAAVIASSTAMAAVAASSTAMAAVAASSTAMAAVIASSTAMAAVIASSTAMAAVAASSTAMAAVIASSTAMAAVIASSTAMAAVAASSTAMAAVIASSTAMAAVIASSTAMAAVYASTSAITAIMPTAWGVYAPHASRLTLSGSNVTQWSDASANARHFVQAGGTAQPLFNATNPVNGYSTLVFDGSNDVLTTTTSYAMPADLTVYIVRRKAAAVAALLGTDSANSVGALVEYDTANLAIDAGSPPSSNQMNVGATLNTWELLRFRNTGSTTWGKKNAGTEVSTGADMLTGTRTLSIGRVNEADQLGDIYLNGRIAEIIILSKNAADGDAEGDRITNLLKTKYALW